MSEAKSIKLAELAKRIGVHLQKFAELERHKPATAGAQLGKYYNPTCWAAGSRLGIRYVSYQTNSYLSKADAIAYLDWLDAGNCGKHYRVEKPKIEIKKAVETKKPKAVVKASTIKPIGLHAKRVRPGTSDYREVAFVEQWQSDHDDILNLLLRVPCEKDDPNIAGCERGTGFPYSRPIGVPTERDRIIAETLIQWLGSNCGMAFVQAALRRVGGDVVWPSRIDKE